MAEVSRQGVHFSYETAGDGFPLVLAPGPQEVWSLYIPLLGELCRTIMYIGHDLKESPSTEALHPSARAAEMLGTFLESPRPGASLFGQSGHELAHGFTLCAALP